MVVGWSQTTNCAWISRIGRCGVDIDHTVVLQLIPSREQHKANTPRLIIDILDHIGTLACRIDSDRLQEFLVNTHVVEHHGRHRHLNLSPIPIPKTILVFDRLNDGRPTVAFEHHRLGSTLRDPNPFSSPGVATVGQEYQQPIAVGIGNPQCHRT